jgi:hypothetical protein
MKKLTITALALMSSSAFATDARVDAHQGNAAITDDTDYQSYFARTDNGKDSIWFDSAGADLSGAYRNDGAAITMGANATGTGTDFGVYSADGDTGFAVLADITSFDAITIGGGYGMSDGKDDMAFYGSLSMIGDAVGFGAGVRSRALTDDDVTFWSAGASYSDIGIGVGANGGMGWRYKTDRSRGGLTVGPSLGVDMPEGGDMALDISLVDVNLAGEFALNDWLGLRGSVVSGADLVGLSGDGDIGLTTQMVSPKFGASLDFEGADVDFMVNPSTMMSWPNPGDQFAATMSARFDI